MDVGCYNTSMVQFVSNHRLSFKCLHLILFIVLWIIELADGRLTVADLLCPILILLVSYDLFMHFKSPNYSIFNLRVEQKSQEDKKTRLLMNLFLGLLLFMGLFSESLPSFSAYKFLVVFWSLAYLIVNINFLRKQFVVSRFIMFQISFLFFIGSIFFVT